MKYIKKFESEKLEYKPGDYVLMYTNSQVKEYADFINKTYGIIHRIRKASGIYEIVVEYKDENVPDEAYKFMIRSNTIKGPLFKAFDNFQIVEFANTKEELDAKIDAKNYML